MDQTGAYVIKPFRIRIDCLAFKKKYIDLKRKRCVALLFNVLLSHPIKVLTAYHISLKKTLPRMISVF